MKETSLSDKRAVVGELLKEIEPKYSMGSVEGTNRPHREKTLPNGITKTFEGYCRQRWQFARRTAYQFIDSVKVIDNVRNCAQMPNHESQLRPLSRLEPEQQREAWEADFKKAGIDLVVDVHELSDYLDLSPRRIQQLAREGVIPKSNRQYDLLDSIEGYMHYLVQQVIDKHAGRRY